MKATSIKSIIIDTLQACGPWSIKALTNEVMGQTNFQKNFNYSYHIEKHLNELLTEKKITIIDGDINWILSVF